MNKQQHSSTVLVWLSLTILLTLLFQDSAFGRDLPDIQKDGILRHLGIPYANFVTGSGDGLDVELIQLFAGYLGVKYEFVETNWEDGFGDLIGRKVYSNGNHIELREATPVRGDLMATGLTIIPWRQQVIDYSVPVFPSAVWLIARVDSPLQPIKPSGDTNRDITAVKAMLSGHVVLGSKNTCLDPDLYDLQQTGAELKLLNVRNPNEMVPVILNGDAETTLLDVADALIALEKWPGEIKVIGPISSLQEMGVAFSKDTPQLREAFNRFFQKINSDGTYLKLVKKYYPLILRYYNSYFENLRASSTTSVLAPE
jgi:ABC-type amino acid transport substrate-binding protein